LKELKSYTLYQKDNKANQASAATELLRRWCLNKISISYRNHGNDQTMTCWHLHFWSTQQEDAC
jgi:hypothetical protein